MSLGCRFFRSWRPPVFHDFQYSLRAGLPRTIFRDRNIWPMKLSIARLFAVILIAVSISDACAWSGPGHMTVAAIAYRDLSPAERQKLDTILESHPQFQSWL